MIDRAIGWLTDCKHSTHGLAATRIVLGFIVASQLVLNWSDRQYTWGVGARWATPVRDAREWPAFLGVFTQVGGTGFDLLYLATILSGVLPSLAGLSSQTIGAWAFVAAAIDRIGDEGIRSAFHADVANWFDARRDVPHGTTMAENPAHIIDALATTGAEIGDAA